MTPRHLAHLQGQDRITAAALQLSRVLCFGEPRPAALLFALYALVAAVREFYGSSFGPQPFTWLEGHECDGCPRRTA